MALQNWYGVGSASVTNGETTVTGHNTLWTQAIRAGDAFGTHVAGARVRIAAVVSDTELTLAYAWAGSTQNDAAYEIEIIPDRSRQQETGRRVLERLNSGGFFRADATSAMGPRDAFDNARIDFYWLDLDPDPVELWYKQSGNEGDWFGPLSYLTGQAGPAPNVAAGTTTTVAPGENASVSLTGVNPNYTLNFEIPGGATLDVGSATTLNPGQSATAENIGTIHEAVLDIGIPRGANGWAFEPAVEADGANRDVIRVADFIGGEGTKPSGTGQYLGPAGLVATAAEAKNIRGNEGAQGPRGVRWRGEWADDVQYNPGDLVTDEDGDENIATWIALEANLDSRPRDNATDWDVFPGSFASTLDDGLITDSITDELDDGLIAA